MFILLLLLQQNQFQKLLKNRSLIQILLKKSGSSMVRLFGMVIIENLKQPFSLTLMLKENLIIPDYQRMK